MNLTEALARTETMWGQGQYLSAKAQYEDLLSQYTEPTARAKISYEYATLHYRHTGDGEEARRLFQVVMEQYAKVETKMDSRDREIEVNACENLMLLSLSYEEYDTWAGRLGKIAPRSKMLSDHREVVNDMRDKFAWFEVMHEYASTYYDSDPSKNQGLYASAAAMLQLMLKNRETLRFSRSDWGFATRAYAELIGLIAAKTYQNQERVGGVGNAREFLFVVQGAIPLIEEYINANPSDVELKKLEHTLREIENGSSGSSANGANATHTQIRQLTLNLNIGTIIANSYTVTRIRDGKVSPDMSEYVSKATVLELDSKYENQSMLSFYILKGPVPPKGKWPLIGLAGLSNMQVKRSWQPQGIQVPCAALEYTARTANGAKVAVIHMMAASKTAFVLAITTWAGFPGFNRFSVGVKPGMEMRNEDLLKAGLELSKDITAPMTADN